MILPGKYGVISLFIMSAAIVIFTIVSGPNPFAKLEDFTSVTGNITEKKIEDFSGSRHGHFDLRIYVWSKGSYYLSESSREPIDRYFAAVPTNGPITIHFRDDLDGHRIYDARDGERIFIPFTEIRAEVVRRQILAIAGAALLAFLGWLTWPRGSNSRKNVPTDYERPNHQFTPR